VIPVTDIFSSVSITLYDEDGGGKTAEFLGCISLRLLQLKADDEAGSDKWCKARPAPLGPVLSPSCPFSPIARLSILSSLSCSQHTRNMTTTTILTAATITRILSLSLFLLRHPVTLPPRPW